MAGDYIYTCTAGANNSSLANGTDYHLDGRDWLTEYADISLLLVSATAN